MTVQEVRATPPVEHAPLKTAVRPPPTVSRTAVPTAKLAARVWPEATAMPAGFDVILTPVRGRFNDPSGGAVSLSDLTLCARGSS